MSGAGLQVRRVAKPEQQAGRGPGEGGDRADDRSVGGHDEPDVAVRGAQGADHAECPEPALCQHREAGHRDQAREQQSEDRENTHDHRRAEPARCRRRCLQRRLPREGEGGHPCGHGVEKDGDGIRGREFPRGDEGELITQVAGVLHQAGDPPDAAGGMPVPADADVIEGGHLRRQRDLPGPGRVPARHQRQRGMPEGAVRVLGSQLDGVHRARGEVLLCHYLHRPGG